MMKRRIVVCFLAVLLSGAMAAEGALVQLCDVNEVQLSGATAATRGVQFVPTTAPNPLSGVGAESLFDSAAFGIVIQGADDLTGNLNLYAWDTDYGTSVGGASLGSTSFVGLSGAGVHYETINLGTAQAASGMYVLELTVTGYTATGTTGWGLEKWDGDLAGDNYVPYNNGGAKTTREYMVQVNAVPEPATLVMLMVGGLGFLRRRR